MQIHFVYTVPPIDLLARIRRKATLFSHGYGFGGGWIARRSDVSTTAWPNYSPVSVTKHVYEALKSNFPTAIYDYKERGIISGGKEDILIGHPDPTDSRSIWNQSCERGEFAVRIAMFPLHHARAEVNAPVDRYIPQVDAILGIMGSYWYDTFSESALAHWKPKITRLDMAIDTSYYPKVKTRFNPPGKRKFLYIGNSQPCKGVDLLSILFGLSTRHKCVWIGADSIRFPHLEARQGFMSLDAKFMAKLAEEVDFLIAMGVSDANPTTILEAMAWGFPVCCTPQSGYYNMPEIDELSATDMRFNLAVLDRLQEAREEELLARSNAARQLVENCYTWKRFNDTVLSQLKCTISRKGLSVKDQHKWGYQCSF